MKPSPLFLLTCAVSSHAADSNIANNVMDPEKFVAVYEKALATQDWEKVEPLIHPNCTVTFSSGIQNKGKKNVETAFRRNFALIESEKYAISNIHWVIIKDDFVVFTFTFQWFGIMDGKKIGGAGHGTSSLVKENGIWLLASEHLGPKPTE